MKIIIKIVAIFIVYLNNIYCQETKALWVVRDALTSNNFLSIIDNAKTLKCNKIFLQLRALGKVYYPTKLDIPKYGVDEEMFLGLLKKAKNSNIEVHAWLNFCYINSDNNRTLPNNHIINKSANSIVYSPVNGVKSEGYFLHPNDEKNLSEVKNIVKELLEKYNLDGIHLDYFRYPKDISHTSKSGRTKFIMEYGLDPITPISDPNGFKEKRGIGSYKYFKESYADFLRSELTSTLLEIKALITKINKKAQLSVAVKPNPFKAKHKFYQDWLFWLNNEYCNFVVIMNYSPDEKIFNENLVILRNLVPEIKIIVGIATYNINKEQVIKRVKDIENTGLKGYSLFSYNFIMKNDGLYTYLTGAL